METFSFTRLTTYQTCPRRYFYRYVQKLPEPPAKPLEFGKALHAVLSGVILNQGDVPELTRRAVEASELLDESDGMEIEKMAGWFQKKFSPVGPVRSEHKLTRELLPEVEIIGYADLIEDGFPATITDFKTQWDRYEPVDTMQLPLYAWMAAPELGPEIEARLWFVRYFKDPMRRALIGPEEQERAVAWARGLVREIAEASELPGWAGFPERPGKPCGSCGYADRCLGVEVPEDVQEMAGLALRLERVLDQVKLPVKDYVSVLGPVEVNGEFFGLYPKSSWRFGDIAAFFRILAKAGADPWDYIEVNPWKLKKLLSGPLGPALRAIGDEKQSSYFSHRDKPPEVA